MGKQISKYLGSFCYSKSAKFKLEYYMLYSICKEKKYPKLFSPQIKKRLGPQANPKSAVCHICGKSANLTNYLSPQICGFAELIC
jgi:hypothetical protein